MSSDENDPFAALTEAVKSRILDRIITELKEGRSLGLGPSGYTKSELGVYGKYQKQDIDPEQMLEAVKLQVDSVLREYEDTHPRKAKDSTGPRKE